MDWRWPFTLVVVTGLITWWAYTSIYPLIPDPMPTHWNASNEPDSFRTKTPQTFFFQMLLGPAIMVLTLLGAQALIALQSAHLTERGSGIADAHHAHRVWHGYQHMMGSLGWYLVGLSLLISGSLVCTYHPDLPHLFSFMLVGSVGLTALLIWSGVRCQNQLERRFPPPEHERGKRWGIFYNDPNDERIFVEWSGSMGANFTTNIGHAKGKITTAIVFGAPLLLVIVLLVL